MSLLLGLVVAASFGSGDFLGGLASKRARTHRGALHRAAVPRSSARSPIAVIAGGDPHGGDFALGALGGVLNVAALGCLYQGLAVGRAGLVAPVAAVVGAVIPVVWGLASGEDPAVGCARRRRARDRRRRADLGRSATSTRPADAEPPHVAAARAPRRRGLRVLVRLLREHARRVGVLARALGPGRGGDRGRSSSPR